MLVSSLARFAAVVVVGFALSACLLGSHVELGPLPDNPTAAQRVDAFNKYRPAGEVITVDTRTGAESADSLVLAGGEEVEMPEDLAPVVPPTSTTATAGRTAAHARRYKRLSVVGVVASLVVGFIIQQTTDIQSDLGIGVAIVGGAAFAASGVVFYIREQRATEEAFDTYQRSLLERLQLCVQGLAAVPCEGVTK